VFDEQNRLFLSLIAGPLGKNDPMRRGNDRPIRESAAPYSSNVFYYWHRFVQLHEKYEGIPKSSSKDDVIEVYDDFEPTSTSGFPIWWRTKGSWIFGGEYEETARAEGMVSAADFMARRDGIGIFFPFNGNLEDMLKQAEEEFKKARQEYYKIKPSLKAKYTLHSKRYEIKSLYNKAVIYAAVRNAPNDESFDSIFMRIKSNLILERSQDDMTPDRATKWMSDNFDGACRLAYHAARGEFPNFRKPQGPYNPRKQWGA